MIRKTILSTIAAIVLATSAVSVSTSSASAGNRDRDIAIAVGVGVIAGILGAKAKSHRNHGGHRNRGGHHIDRHDDNECFDKPVRKWRHGRKVVVGYRTICR